jgi:hypothetical protein
MRIYRWEEKILRFAVSQYQITYFLSIPKN